MNYDQHFSTGTHYDAIECAHKLCTFCDECHTTGCHNYYQPCEGELAILLKKEILHTANYYSITGFPTCVESLSTLEELVGWLATAPNTGTVQYAVLCSLLTCIENIYAGQTYRRLAPWLSTYAIEDAHTKRIIDQDCRAMQQPLENIPHATSLRYWNVLSGMNILVQEQPEFQRDFAQWVHAQAIETFK